MKKNLLNYISEDRFNEVKEMDNLYLKALLLVESIFNNRGKNYMGHLYRVSNNFSLDIEKVASILHNILEGTNITDKDLLDIGFPQDIIEIVKLITPKKDKNEIADLIESGNIHAIKVKKADILDHLDLYVLKNVSKDIQQEIHKKYDKQLIKLERGII